MSEWSLLLAALVAVLPALAEFLVPDQRRFWLRLLIQAGCLAILSVALLRVAGSPIAPVYAGSAMQRVLEQVIAVAWWAMTARMAVILARLLLTHDARPRESRILLDLLAAVIYVTAALSIVAFVFDTPVRGLVATSGVIAIVLGLALQNTLGDLFSGIAVGVERPYRAGDHLSIDGGVKGRVVEVNWRSTHIAVGHDLVIVPNSLVAKSRLVNHSEPTSVSGESLEVRVHPEVPPRHVLSVLQAALLSCDRLMTGVAATPLCSGIAGDGVTYTLTFAAASADLAASARSEVLSQVHRHLFHAGVPLATAGAAPSAGWRVRTLSAEELLAGSDLFAGVSEQNRAALASELKLVELQAGEILFKQGTQPDAMFMIATGTIEVLSGGSETATRRHLLAPGESVGLVALVTGQPYRTSATALNAVRVFRLDAGGLAAALADAPDLADELETAVRRALAVMAGFDVSEDQEAKQKVALLGRLRVFLRAIR